MKAEQFLLMRGQFLAVAQMLGIPVVLFVLSSTASAQIEPALLFWCAAVRRRRRE